jgi:hypothetical protein
LDAQADAERATARPQATSTGRALGFSFTL